MILLIQHGGIRGVHLEMVHALTHLGKCVGQEVGSNTGVLGHPGASAIVGPEDPGRRDADEESIAVRRVRADRVHHQTARARGPALPGRVLGQRAVLLPGLAAVAAHEQRAGVDAGQQCRAGRARRLRDRPDAIHRQTPVLGESNRAGRLAPRLPEIVREAQRGSPPLALAGGDDQRPRPGHAGHVVDLDTLEEEPAELPVLPGPIGERQEGPLARPDQEHDVSRDCPRNHAFHHTRNPGWVNP